MVATKNPIERPPLMTAVALLPHPSVGLGFGYSHEFRQFFTKHIYILINIITRYLELPSVFIFSRRLGSYVGIIGGFGYLNIYAGVGGQLTFEQRYYVGLTIICYCIGDLYGQNICM